MTQFEDVLETILEEYARRDSEGEFDTWEETDAFVKEKAEVLLAYVKKEPVSEKKCMFTKDSYTDEDRKVLCGGCEEECKYAQKEEPVSEELEEAMQHNAPDNIGIDDLLYWRNGFISGAKWKKQQDQSIIELAEDHAYFAGRTKTMDEIKEALLSEVLPCFMHGGEADEVVAKLDEVLNQKK